MADPSLTYLGAGFAAAFIALAAYLGRLWLAQKRVQERLAALERKRQA